MEKIIKIENLKKYYGKVRGVENVNLEVNKGDIFGFLGPNGAGKTTTIRCLMDFIRPDGGKITMFGKDAHRSAVALKKNIGYLSDEVYIYDNWTGQAHINFVRSLNGKHDIADELVKRLEFDPARRTKDLSFGNRQKLGVILAFMFEPELLILDEPTKGLDPLLQNVVYEIIDEADSKGATIFMSSHNLAEVERVCDRVGIIKEGAMVAIEDIASLKSKRMYTIHAYFTEEFDRKDFVQDGIEITKELKNGLILKARGDINDIVRKLSSYKLSDLEVAQASLEDIFLEFYKDK